jgi:glycosyltransferase involved in cell wall biosynthesis
MNHPDPFVQESAFRKAIGLRVSVVVPTYHREDLLERCLQALVFQDFPKDAYEILVVDDGRSPETEAFVECFRARHDGPHICYLRPPPGKRGPAAARNTGWGAALGEVIAFTDDDTVPMRRWLSRGMRAMLPGVAAVWGHVEVPLPDSPTDAERNTAGLHGAEFITANCFVRREALAVVGGFDERFLRPWREDSDLYFSLLEQGYQVQAAAEAIVIHPVRNAPASACLRQHGNLFYDALLYKKHPDLYRRKIAALPPLRYYAAVVAFVVAVIAGVFGFSELALTGAAVWVLMTAYVVRLRMQGMPAAWPVRAGIVWTSLLIPFLAVFWRLAGSWHYRVAFA